MPEKHTICLLNDSFPPMIDGVANAVVNYAANIEARFGHAVVVTPDVDGADDSAFPYPVLRYPSIDTRKLVGYVAGVPFAPEIAYRIRKENVELLHLHCPIMSAFLAWQLRESMDLPLILTWHTKFDIDIRKAIHGKVLQDSAIKALIENVNACDEVWTVSSGAADNLRSLGYEGDVIVMENGVDLPKGAVSPELTAQLSAQYGLPEGVPVFLFVGRMMWYKGLRIIIDALAALKERGTRFCMVFVGSGGDEKEVKEYVEQTGLTAECTFTGPVRDRELLRAWYSRADLFLFPSTFDTNGLVVREAAACGTASILIKGSCAAEGVTDGRNGFLIEENADSMAQKLEELCQAPERMRSAGENAENELYLSWEDAVERAVQRYEIVLEKHRNGEYKRKHRPQDAFMRSQGELMDILGEFHGIQDDMRSEFQELQQDMRDSFKDVRSDFEDQWTRVHERLYAEEELFMERLHSLRDDIKGMLNL